MPTRNGLYISSEVAAYILDVDVPTLATYDLPHVEEFGLPLYAFADVAKYLSKALIDKYGVIIPLQDLPKIQRDTIQLYALGTPSVGEAKLIGLIVLGLLNPTEFSNKHTPNIMLIDELRPYPDVVLTLP